MMQLNKKNKNIKILMELAIKNTNLNIFTVVTTQLILVVFALDNYEWLITIDTLCNAIGIYLTFAFTDNLYRKVFICHNCCYICCSRTCFWCCKPKEPAMEIYNLTNVMSFSPRKERTSTTATKITMTPSRDHVNDGSYTTG